MMHAERISGTRRTLVERAREALWRQRLPIYTAAIVAAVMVVQAVWWAR